MTLEDSAFSRRLHSTTQMHKLTAKHVMSINKDDIRTVRKHSQLISQFEIRITYDCLVGKRTD
jgi:hypothetical protein